MITLDIQISGGGPVRFNFTSGLILETHLFPPVDGSSLGVVIDTLQPTVLSIASANGNDNHIKLDVAEGPDPVWLAFSIDSTVGDGSVSVSLPGSPLIRVDAGSSLSLEFNNGNPAPMMQQGYS